MPRRYRGTSRASCPCSSIVLSEPTLRLEPGHELAHDATCTARGSSSRSSNSSGKRSRNACSSSPLPSAFCKREAQQDGVIGVADDRVVAVRDRILGRNDVDGHAGREFARGARKVLVVHRVERDLEVVRKGNQPRPHQLDELRLRCDRHGICLPRAGGASKQASRLKPREGEYQPRGGITSPRRRGTLGSSVAKRSPILGYNHNVRYRGLVFHVQTEDSGVLSPHLFTHLFHEGVIVSTRKLVYDAGSDEDAIKALMQAQHKAVMKDLKKGSFDDKIDQYLGGTEGLLPREAAEGEAASEGNAAPEKPRAKRKSAAPPITSRPGSLRHLRARMSRHLRSAPSATRQSAEGTHADRRARQQGVAVPQHAAASAATRRRCADAPQPRPRGRRGRDHRRRRRSRARLRSSRRDRRRLGSRRHRRGGEGQRESAFDPAAERFPHRLLARDRDHRRRRRPQRAQSRAARHRGQRAAVRRGGRPVRAGRSNELDPCRCRRRHHAIRRPAAEPRRNRACPPFGAPVVASGDHAADGDVASGRARGPRSWRQRRGRGLRPGTAVGRTAAGRARRAPGSVLDESAREGRLRTFRCASTPVGSRSRRDSVDRSGRGQSTTATASDPTAVSSGSGSRRAAADAQRAVVGCTQPEQLGRSPAAGSAHRNLTAPISSRTSPAPAAARTVVS